MGASMTFIIHGVLRGKQRPRSTRQGRVYTPSETVNAEAWVRQCAVAECGSPVLQTPIRLQMGVAVAVPLSWSKKKRAAALKGELRPTGKPDLDNCVKLVCDALNGIMWRDDSQVVSMELRKFYAEIADTVVTVSEVLP